MALLDPLLDGPIDAGSRFRLRIAGAESNFAIALRRLEVPVTWVSRVGSDAFGDLIVRTIASEGVDVRYVKVVPDAPTGIYFKVREAGSTRVFYYRSGSAASRMTVGDVPDGAWDGVKLVHLTGITMGISPTARELVVATAAQARARGATVIFDPNFRPALWRDPEEASAAYRQVLPHTDWYLSGLDECRLLLGPHDVDQLFSRLRGAGAKGAVLRVAERGAVIDVGDGPVEIPPRDLATVVDEIGAGDGFAAGFAFGLLRGWSVPDCVSVANVVAACALRATGDWETYPTLQEISPFLSNLATLRVADLEKN